MSQLGTKQEYSAIPTIDEHEQQAATNGVVRENNSWQLTIAFFFLGAGVLLPWNSVLSVLDYYATLFPIIPIAQFLTNFYTFPVMVTGTILAIAPIPSRFRPHIIFLCFSILSFIAICLPIIGSRDTPYDDKSSALTSFTLFASVGLVALMGIAGSFVQSNIYGVVNLFPGGNYVTAFNTGGAAASVLVVGMRMFTRFVLDTNESGLISMRPGFQFFFSICTILCLCCIAVFLWMHFFNAEYSYNLHRWETINDMNRTTSLTENLYAVRATIGDIALPALCLLLNFSSSMLLFPGILTNIPYGMQESFSTAAKSWYPLIVVMLFALGDTAGRTFYSRELVSKNPRALPWFTIGKILAIPVYFSLWSGLIRVNCGMIFLLVFLHGYLNGFIMNMAFVDAPRYTSEDKWATTGRIMFVMLIMGLFLGSACGWFAQNFLATLAPQS